MKTLLRFECKKLFRSRLFLLCAAALLLTMLGLIAAEWQDAADFRNNAAYRDEVLSWREREQNAVTFGTQSLAEDTWLTPLQRDQLTRRIAIAQYRLDNDIQKDIYKNMWWFFNDNSFNACATLVTVLVLLLGSACLAGEYSGHTLRQVLLLPYKRGKILFAKLLATASAGMTLYAALLVLGLLSGLLLHGTDGAALQVVLYYGKTLTTMPMGLYSVLVVLLKLPPMLFYTALLLPVAVLSRSTAASALLTGIPAVFAVPALNFLSSYYPWVQYLPFANVDFRRYLDFGTVMPQIEAGWSSVVTQGISPALSAGILLGTAVLCGAVAFRRFRRQDF